MNNEMFNPSVSILVPFYYKRMHFLKKLLTSCEKIEYDNFEVLVISNRPVSLNQSKTKNIVISGISQGEKFDAGINASDSDICTFVGDDTYFESDWIKQGVKYFKDDSIIAVGGPGLTPPDSTPRQKASGLIYSSLMGVGFTNFRHSQKTQRVSDDLPATNLFVRRSALIAVGGVDIPYRSGEDTYLCNKLNM